MIFLSCNGQANMLATSMIFQIDKPFRPQAWHETGRRCGVPEHTCQSVPNYVLMFLVPVTLRPGTELDAEARLRGTSVYLMDRVIPMLPRRLCEELCSLQPGGPRLTFSIIWDLSSVRCLLLSQGAV